MYWPKCLTYGNWGGPGWSAGRFNDDPAQTDWSVEPIDDMDALFRMHDFMYQHGVGRHAADLELCKSLVYCNVVGVCPNIYRAGAIMIFAVRSFL